MCVRYYLTVETFVKLLLHLNFELTNVYSGCIVEVTLLKQMTFRGSLYRSSYAVKFLRVIPVNLFPLPTSA